MGHQLKLRFIILDQMRGLAVLLMIIFHFAYDLNIFNFVNINFSKDLFWWVLPRIIVTLFLLSMGISLSLVHYPKINWQHFKKRFGLITIYALLISLSTYFLFPKNWIYFGTLHCIAITGFISLFFLHYPKVCLFLGLALIIPSVFFKINLPFFTMKHQSMDYIPVFPWIGVVFIGIFLKKIKFHQFVIFKNMEFNSLQFLGRHALFIYILHQPIIYGLVYTAFLILDPLPKT